MEALFLSVCTAIVQHFAQHIKAYGSAFGLFVFVAISNMPKPGVKWTKLVVYTWLYDTVQTVLPVNRGSHLQFQLPAPSEQHLLAAPGPTPEVVESSSVADVKNDIPMPPRYGAK